MPTKELNSPARLATHLIGWLMIAILAAGCTVEGTGLRPVEAEQIENVVQEYYVRSASVPDIDVTVEEVWQNWARIVVSPVGTETDERPVLYLQNQASSEILAPTAPPAENLLEGSQAEVTTSSGWTIIAGPQVHFTAEELDSAGVPPEIRDLDGQN